MPNGNQDPLELAKKLSESFREVKFGPGVVGKTTYATLSVLGLWGIVLFRLSGDWWLNLALLTAGIAGSGLYWWWVSSTQKFATENPSLALLDGAQLLEYQRFEAQIKGQLGGTASPRIVDPRVPLQIEGDPQQPDK